MNTKSIGDLGESLARRFIVRKLGLKILSTNAHMRFSEIDVLAMDFLSDEVVIFEVRTRRTRGICVDFEAILPMIKQNRLRGLQRLIADQYHSDVRVDLIFIELTGSKYKIKHYKDFLANC